MRSAFPPYWTAAALAAYGRDARAPSSVGADHRRYSLSTLSAHSTKATRSGGLTNWAFLPRRSLSRTARAREQAVQTWTGILCLIVLAMISASGGQPTGVTAAINSSRIRLT